VKWGLRVLDCTGAPGATPRCAAHSSRRAASRRALRIVRAASCTPRADPAASRGPEGPRKPGTDGETPADDPSDPTGTGRPRRTVDLVDVRTGTIHLLTPTAAIAGSHCEGRYVALCGATVLWAADLTDPGRARRAACTGAVTTVNPRPFLDRLAATVQQLGATRSTPRAPAEDTPTITNEQLRDRLAALADRLRALP
jgi:hypothetical protein